MFIESLLTVWILLEFLFIVCWGLNPVLISLWGFKSFLLSSPSLPPPPDLLRSIQCLILFTQRKFLLSFLYNKKKLSVMFQMCLPRKSFVHKHSDFWKMLFWRPDCWFIYIILVLRTLVFWKVSPQDCGQIGSLLCLNRSSTLILHFLLVFRF